MHLPQTDAVSDTSTSSPRFAVDPEDGLTARAERRLERQSRRSRSRRAQQQARKRAAAQGIEFEIPMLDPKPCYDSGDDWGYEDPDQRMYREIDRAAQSVVVAAAYSTPTVEQIVERQYSARNWTGGELHAGEERTRIAAMLTLFAKARLVPGEIIALDPLGHLGGRWLVVEVREPEFLLEENVRIDGEYVLYPVDWLRVPHERANRYEFALGKTLPGRDLGVFAADLEMRLPARFVESGVFARIGWISPEELELVRATHALWEHDASSGDPYVPHPWSWHWESLQEGQIAFARAVLRAWEEDWRY